jgi:hypothetical protein
VESALVAEAAVRLFNGICAASVGSGTNDAQPSSTNTQTEIAAGTDAVHWP